MTPLRIFISSVQREFAEERAALRDYLRGDPLMWRFFEAFLFEDVPATDRRPDDLYLDDLDGERMTLFIRTARRARQFPLSEATSPADLLAHLHLLKNGRPTNAAVLLFGRSPQRFLLSSEIKCAHFHGTRVAKPIPSYQVCKGTAFELVDQAVDFVLSKINRAIGTRAESVQAPRTYEIPPEVVIEAIVNAVAHRDYTNNGSVQVMLFADRLEVWNPGRLAPPLTLEKLRVAHPSVPGNPLLAECLYLAEYIERMGTGTLDMIRRCVGAGLPEPEFTSDGDFVTTIRRPSPGRHVTGEAEPGEKPHEGWPEPREKPGEKGRGYQAAREKTGEKLLTLISREPEITTATLADRVGITRKGIEWQIRALKRAGRLERVGPDRGGHWRVVQEDNG